MQNRLIEKIESRKATLAVIGLGYVGLPLAGVMACPMRGVYQQLMINLLIIAQLFAAQDVIISIHA
jgi:UDP-N-acetyl-D-mannosaminuronate dehydrogenase